MKVEIRGRITIPASQVTPGSFQPGAYTIPGSLTIAQGVIAALATGLAQTVEWNNAAVVFVAQDVNVTDTASSVASLLTRWRVGGATVASMDKTGIFRPYALSVTTQIGVVAKSQIKSSVDGVINFTNNGNSGFTRLTLGLETALFPSLKVNGAGITIIAGDNATPANLQVTGNLQLGNAYAAGAIVATGTVDILDATGTVYHVLVHN